MKTKKKINCDPPLIKHNFERNAAIRDDRDAMISQFGSVFSQTRFFSPQGA